MEKRRAYSGERVCPEYPLPLSWIETILPLNPHLQRRGAIRVPIATTSTRLCPKSNPSPPYVQSNKGDSALPDWPIDRKK